LDNNNHAVRTINLNLACGATNRYAAPGATACRTCDGDGFLALGGLTANSPTTCSVVFSVTTLAGKLGVAGAVDGAAADARFNDPWDIIIDSRRDVLFVADYANHAVRMINITSGATSTLAGELGVAGAADGAAAVARFNGPQGITLDSGRDLLFVTDVRNQAVRMVNITSGATSTLVGKLAPLCVFSCDEVPCGQCTTGCGGSWCQNSNGQWGTRNRCLCNRGGACAPAVGPSFCQQRVAGITVDSGRGVLFVTDELNHAVRMINITSGATSTLAGELGVAGAADGAAAVARFNGPQGITLDSGRDVLFVVDFANHAVRMVDIMSGATSTLAGQLGVAGAVDGAAADARFNGPYGITIDPGRDVLYVTDDNSHALSIYNNT
jgi:DNA-binding beta-propeller fold protein YncE